MTKQSKKRRYITLYSCWWKKKRRVYERRNNSNKYLAGKQYGVKQIHRQAVYSKEKSSGVQKHVDTLFNGKNNCDDSYYVDDLIII